MNITLDEETHIYRNDRGEEIPSVTQIISSVFPIQYNDYTAMLRGRAVHKAIHLLQQNILDWATVDERIKMYVLAYENFRTETRVEPIASEQLVYNRVYQYAGTLDMRTERAVYDFKTGVEVFTHGLQLAAYVEAVENVPLPESKLKRFSVYLSDTGNFKLKEYTDKTDLYDFIACLRIFRRKKKEGLL